MAKPATMQRRHFELIAKAIKSLDVDDRTRAHVAVRFGCELIPTNEAFNLSRFLDACGT